MERERALRLALWLVRGISGRSIAAAACLPGGLEAAAALPRAELAARLGLGPAAAAALAAAPADLAAWAEAEAAALARRGGRFVWRHDPEAPHLRSLADPPEFLSVRGGFAGAGSGRAVAVIGARRADPAAVELARRFGTALARSGFTVVSGGALGIDAAAHAGALEAGGATVAVLGSGALVPQPASNRALFARMLGAGGGLVSELPPAAGAMSWHFPRRNRLVAALVRAVVVVRAAAGSGCAYTVEAAERLGVQVLAVPEAVPGGRNAYCEALVGRGRAVPVSNAASLLAALGVRVPERRVAGLAPEERLVLDALGASPAPLGAVAAAAGLQAGRAAQLIAGLCARGLARSAGPGRFAAVDDG